MFPLPLLAAFLVVAPPSAAQSGAPLEQARAAFESAAPITSELRQAVARSADADALGKTLDAIAALEADAGATGAPSADSDVKALDDLARRVNALSDALKVDGEARRAAALNLYVARWQSGRAGLTPSQAAAQRKFAQARLATAMKEQSGAQARVSARLHDLDGFTSRAAGAPGPAGTNLAAAGAGAARAAATGAALINSAGRPQGLHTGTVPDPAAGAAAAAAASAPCPKDGALATVFNLEKCSMKGTPNRESEAGTKATICSLLKKAKYDPDAAYALAITARQRPDADPGDLDLRNAEHYLYSYTTASAPHTLGDTAPVQVILAIGWTPFKTITKYVRPTSTPSMEEMSWGVKGALNAVRAPDWRGECGGAAPSGATSA